jgi:hypothetical protein
MLSSVIASKSAKLIAACVCPVVGAGTLTMSVPKVRNAVHKVTAPREYALPKTRERLAVPASAIAPCKTLGATPLSAGYIEDMPEQYTPLITRDPVDGFPIISVQSRSPGIGKSPFSPVSSGAVPEPQTWLQLLLGFTLVGGAVRMTRKRPTEDDEMLLDRLDELKKQA